MFKLKKYSKNLFFIFLFLLSFSLSVFNYFLLENSKKDLEVVSLLNEMEATIERIKFITLFNYMMLSSERNYSYELKREFIKLEETYRKVRYIANSEVDKRLEKLFEKNIDIGKQERNKIKLYEEKIINLNQLIEKIKSPLKSSMEIFIKDILNNPNVPSNAKQLVVELIYSLLQDLYSENQIKEEKLRKLQNKLEKYSYIPAIHTVLSNIKELKKSNSLKILERDIKIYLYDETLTTEIEKLKERIEGEQNFKNFIFSIISIVIIILYILTVMSLYVAYLGTQRKVKEFMKIKKELENIVERDELTDLGNRLAFIKDKNQLREPTLILLNIDNFKQVNESYGTEIGDFLLKNLAKTIKNFLSTEALNGKVYRLGADDFGVLLDDYKDKIKEITEKLIKYIENRPFKYGDLYIPISVSAGIALNRPLFEKADMALRYVKESRQKYAVYTEDMNIQDKIVNRINVIKTIKRALQEDGIFLVYQPIENLKTNKIEKFEVLVRIIDEKGRVLYPGEFLDVAKGAKLYGEITKKVLEKTFNTLEEYDVELSVNLSVEDVVDENIRFLIRKYIKNPLLAKKLTFEILEDMAIEEYKEEFKEFIDEMRIFGVKIAIDDFGSGYSNFAHILNLKPDFIKIDGSLIKEIDVKEKNRLISETIVSFCKKLGIKTVAEFVWNKDVYETVKKIGFDYAQGFYISKPLTKLPVEKRKKEEI
ncbi:MAG: hypothetical protein DSY59_02025 [Persephonella sp.]|nr:MAG: hypothetical protein DSY59_02025 [Persephonella sp.]